MVPTNTAGGVLPKAQFSTRMLIQDVCQELYEFLAAKNEAYGDSALNPVRIFSTADATEQLKVRIDDKLNRLLQGKEYDGDDTVKDLAGYLILLMVAQKKVSADEDS